jgi:hypothetical protein
LVTGRYRNRSRPVRPVTAVNRPVTVGKSNPASPAGALGSPYLAVGVVAPPGRALNPSPWPSLSLPVPFPAGDHHCHKPRPGCSRAARPRFGWLELTLAYSSTVGARFAGVDLDSTGGGLIRRPQAPFATPPQAPPIAYSPAAPQAPPVGAGDPASASAAGR